MNKNFGKIKVIGIGGAGCNCIKYLATQELKNVDLIMANTDKKALRQEDENLKLPAVILGKDLDCNEGSRGDSELGHKSAMESYEELKMALKGAKLVFIRAGMGGGTGSGASVVAAEIAKKLGAVTVALVSIPFYFEGSKRKVVAEEWLKKLRQKVDGMAIMPNDNLLQNQPGEKNFNVVMEEGESYFKDIIKILSCLWQYEGELLYDFMKRRGLCFIGGGKGCGIDGLANAVNRATESLENWNRVEIEKFTFVFIIIAKKNIDDENEEDEILERFINQDIVDMVWVENEELEDDEVGVVILGA